MLGVQALGHCVWRSLFRALGLEFRFGVVGLEFSGFWVWSFRFRVLGFGVQDYGFRI